MVKWKFFNALFISEVGVEQGLYTKDAILLKQEVENKGGETVVEKDFKK